MSSWVAMLGSLELLTSPLGLDCCNPGLGSGDRSRSLSGDDAYENRDVIGNRKSSDRASSGWKTIPHKNYKAALQNTKSIK